MANTQHSKITPNPQELLAGVPHKTQLKSQRTGHMGHLNICSTLGTHCHLLDTSRHYTRYTSVMLQKLNQDIQ